MKRGIMKMATVGAAFFLLHSAMAQEWCGTMNNVYRHVQEDPAIKLRFDRMMDTLREQYQTASSRSAQATDDADDIIYIPVVFHIVHNGKAVGVGENISDAQVQSQIDAMNLHFNALDPKLSNVPAPFQSVIADCQIKFCLAKFDPQGVPTTGIIRHSFPVATWNTTDSIDKILKPATIWDRTKYLNIWSVRMGGDIAAQGVLAYATLPFTGTATDDGVVARYNTIGTFGVMQGYQQGKTVTHEVGHWLGLLHVWGFSTGCGGQGDFISDTPDQNDANYGCPAFPHVSCPSAAPNGDMFMNYMDYTLDDCRSMFTLGQKDRIYSSLNGVRSGLKTAANTKCFYNLDADVWDIAFPADTICSLTFTPMVTIRNGGVVTLTSGKFYFQTDGGSVQIMNWQGSIASQHELQIALPVQQVSAGSHTFDVTFAQVNGQPADNYAANDSRSVAFVAYDGGAGVAAPFAEGFEHSVFPPPGWQISNPQNDLTWQHHLSIGGFGQNGTSAFIDNLNYATNPNKRKDALLTDAYDLTTLAYPELKFDVAYAKYNTSRSDSLNVYYSVNCGSTWVKIWNQNGADLATAPDQTTLFTPTAAQWKTVSLPLPHLSGYNKVSFKFENVSGWGNALYLDNINLSSDPVQSIADEPAEQPQLYPNPASDLLAIRLPLHHNFHTLTIRNSMGALVYSASVAGDVTMLSVKNFPAGLYFVQLAGNHSSATKKFIITH